MINKNNIYLNIIYNIIFVTNNTSSLYCFTSIRGSQRNNDFQGNGKSKKLCNVQKGF